MRKFAALAILLAVVTALVVGFVIIRRAPRAVPTKTLTLQLVAQNQSVTSLDPSDTTIHDVVEELAQAKPATKVATWRGAHPGEHGEPDSDSASSCVQFKRTVKLDTGLQLNRTATFYLPEPNAAMELPAAGDKSELLDTCVLGLVEVQLWADQKNVYGSLPTIKAALTDKFGAPGDKRSDFIRPLGPVWNFDGAVVFIENPAPTAADIAGFIGKTTDALRLYAYLPKFESEKETHPEQSYRPISPDDSPEIYESALHIAAIENDRNAMTRLYQDCLNSPRLTADLKYYQEKHTTPGLARARKVVDTLQRWMERTQDLPQQRRAAALLAAYFLLGVATQRLDASETEAVSGWLRELQLLPTEAAPTAHRIPPIQWLAEARDLDPDGPIGEAIVFMSLATWRASGLVPEKYLQLRKNTVDDEELVLAAEREGQLDFTDYVVAAGQAYLSKPHSLEMTEAMEYLVASAYCDRVEVVQPWSAAKTTPWQQERAASARTEALKHLRAAVAVKSPRSITAWRKAWRLLAGQPTGFSYYDFGE